MDHASEDNVQKKDTLHWTYNLINCMKNGDDKLEEDDLIVVLKDKYPKASYHYLVLPKKDIPSIDKATKKDLQLLDHMEQIANKYITRHKDFQFLTGFHAIPSLYRLHLHVISTDFISPCLKRIKHWNSFTTPFFLHFKDVRKKLEENGEIIINRKIYENFLNTKLKCHKCSYYSTNIPDLKRHLHKHFP